MKVAIHQPDYFPYLGYFYKIARANHFVFLDNCQFSSTNYHHWNRIKTPQGEHRIKIPVEYTFGEPIHLVRTRDELGWKKKHLETIRANYGRARFFRGVFPELEAMMLKKYACLAEMNMEINTWIARKFGLVTAITRASELVVSAVHEERIIDICNNLGGDTYISGNGARVYQNIDNFAKRQIKLIYSDYVAIEYDQLWNERIGFIPNLSVLDYILNCGFDWDRVINAVEKSKDHGNR